MTKKYDFKKAKMLIEENKNNVTIASLGMKEDWFYTAETIYENNKYEKDLDTIKQIGGIDGSCWATPVLHLQFNDDNEKFIDCYIDDGEKPDLERKKMVEMSLGCLSKPIQDKINDI